MSQLQSTQTKKHTHPEHCEAVNNFGKTKVGNFYDGWVILCEENVLRIDSVSRGETSARERVPQA